MYPRIADLAVDPLDSVLGDRYSSRYSYVGGSPTALYDPSGLRAWNATVGQISYADVLQGPLALAGEIGAAFAPPAYRDQIRQATAPLSGSFLDTPITLHGTLDILGMVPVIGNVADVANGVLYLAEGNKLDAALAFGSAIPFAGLAAGGAKLVKLSLIHI